MTFTPDQTKLLSAKLDQSHVKPPKQFGPKGDYIEGWHAIAEANRIFGYDAWSYSIVNCSCVSERPREIGKDKKPGFGVTYIATVRIEAGGALREDVGSGHGYDQDCGLAHESAIKEAVTDALKRGLRTFGNPFGLALYDKSRENVADAASIAADAATDNLWQELTNIRSAAGLKSFWIDNSKNVANMDDFNRVRFTKKKDELKAAFDKPKDTVQQIQDEFPGARVVRDEDMFPGDMPPFTDAEVRQHPINGG